MSGFKCCGNGGSFSITRISVSIVELDLNGGRPVSK
jgi:hypothetical protein